MAESSLHELIEAFNDMVVQVREVRRELSYMRDMMSEMAARYHRLHCVRDQKLFGKPPKEPKKPPEDPPSPYVPVFED